MTYSGGIKVLQKEQLLPITKPQSFKGISGASAGAITSFLLSLGMKYADVKAEVDSNPFKQFFEDPHPGMYRGVKVYNGKATVGYVTDEFNTRTQVTKSVLDNVVIGKNFFDQSEKTAAFAEGMRNHQKLRNRTVFTTVMPDLLERIEDKKLKKSESDIVTKIKEKKGNPDLYLSSLLMDRGLFSGISIREYFQKVAYETLKKYYGNRPAFAEIAQAELSQRTYQVEGEPKDYSFINSILTFNKLHEITGKTLHITSTNMSQCKPVIFCTSPDKPVGGIWSEATQSFEGGTNTEADPQWDTGDFPVIEAICCSMNIPFVFKSIYVNYFAPNGTNYNGLYGDGGILYNTPIHIWDGGPVEKLNPKVLGLRVNDGYDPEDTTFEKSKLWQDYIFQHKLKNVPKDQLRAQYLKLLEIISEQQKPSTERNSPQRFELLLDTPGELFSIIGALAGYMFKLLFYWPEEGQLRTPQEREQTVLFYSYDVTILDFAPPEPLKKFLALRAEEKLAAYLGVKME